MDGSRFFERTGGATFEEPMCRSGAFGTRTEASRWYRTWTNFLV